MFDNLLTQMQNQSEEIRKKMETVKVTGEAEGGLIKVIANGNKRVLEINISDDIASDKEAVEELLVIAVNRAYEQAEKIHETEMQGMAKGMLPPDLENMFA